VAESPKILYDLLKDRPRYMNISHKRVPSFSQHCQFVRSKPYKEWFFIVMGKKNIGSIYLSLANEIGIFLFKKFQGKGLEREILKKFIFGRRKLRLLANVSLKNKFYQNLFQSLGFRHIQNSYCLEPGSVEG
jgi:RimJ/RimL family protein N-acetyltransferase